jgi:hypothetical protein
MSNQAPNESTLDPNTTPAVGGNDGTTPPQAENQGTTPPEGGNQVDIDKIVKQRLDRERRKWEADRVEAEKRARMDEAERLKADLADRDAKIAAAEAKALAAERIAELTGKVVDPKAALRLWEEDDTLDTFLKRHPYMAPTQDRQAAPAPNGPQGTPRKITRDNIDRMTPDEINKNWDAVKAAFTP